MNSLFILAPATLLLCVYLIHRFRKPAGLIGLVDIPGGRKAHNGHIPVIGGVGMFIAFVFSLLFVDGSLHPYRGMLAGMGLLLVTGVLDDLHDLGVLEKVTFQVIAAVLLMAWGGLFVDHLGIVPGIGFLELRALAVPMTVICVVGLINAVNMLDGADGLCGGVMVTIFFWLAAIGLSAEQSVAMALPTLLGCAVLGFLIFNFPWRLNRCATVFMGDSGSTMLGFAAAWLAIDLTFEQGTGVPPVTIAWIMALPVFDTISLMLRRLLKGRNPLHSDREHLHHIFERIGLPPAGTAYLFAATSFVLGGIGVCAWWLEVPQQWMWPPLLVLLGLQMLFVYRAWRIAHLVRRFLAAHAAQSRG